MRTKLKHICAVLFILIIPERFSSPEITLPFSKWWEPQGLSVFRKAYPDVEFISLFDKDENDWCIHVITKESGGKKTDTALYWCESRFLPKEKLEEKETYRPMLYTYPKNVPDPRNFTKEQIAHIAEFTSKENRQNGAVDPPFLFNAIYDVSDRAHTESHIKKVPFLDGRTVNVHEKIEAPLTRVSERIMALPKTAELERFFSTLSRTDGFNWRSVRDTQSRSFHSIGLAIDILPRGYYQKIIYWGWQKQLHPETWWNTPLESRWTPPQEIIDIFEDEGFIWGGKWIVWDNMHFEYHPELLLYNK